MTLPPGSIATAYPLSGLIPPIPFAQPPVGGDDPGWVTVIVIVPVLGLVEVLSVAVQVTVLPLPLDGTESHGTLLLAVQVDDAANSSGGGGTVKDCLTVG